MLDWFKKWAETEVGRGWLVTLIVINELARHLVTVLAIITSIHLTAAFVSWISVQTGTDVMTTNLLGPFKFKDMILMIDLVLVCKLAYEGYQDINRIYEDERNRRH